MSLLKSVSYVNGAVANYHRIMSISRANDALEVVLRCYADETFRNKEKRKAELEAGYNERMRKLSELCQLREQKDITDEQAKELETIQSEIKELSELQKVSQYYIFEVTKKVEHEDNDDISFKEVYELLSTSDDEFKGAKMC